MNRYDKTKILILLLSICYGFALGIIYDRPDAVDWGNNNWNTRSSKFMDHGPCTDCAAFGSQCLYKGDVPFLRKSKFMQSKGLYEDMDPKDYFSLIHNATTLRLYLVNFIGSYYSIRTFNEAAPNWLAPGDIIFLCYPENNAPFHTLIVTEILNNDCHIVAHCIDRNTKLGQPDGRTSFRDFWQNNWPGKKACYVHIPDVIWNCDQTKFPDNLDSTLTRYPKQHVYHCCWHEQIGPPWSINPSDSNPSFYACLSWEETNGTTWDTLISPRMNLAGCSSIVFRQMSYSNLTRGGNKVIEVRGSTDNGTNWSYYIGTDTLKQASLSWATNQKNVRIAWIYKGPVQANKFWCVDDVEILAKPTRDHDICVSEIACPKGRGGVTTIITQGKTIKPAAFVWNFGKKKMFDNTFKIVINYIGVLSEFWNHYKGRLSLSGIILSNFKSFYSGSIIASFLSLLADRTGFIKERLHWI